MIAILTGAKKNIGDYLIGERAKSLLKKYVDEDILEIDRFGNITQYIDKINQSKALILCGGPAYTSDIYPGIYNLEDIYSRISVPIIPFGLGWSGKPFHSPEEFKFKDKAQFFLNNIHANIHYSSCRDVLTKKILNQTGINNVKMTGCPVWYHLDSQKKEFHQLKEPKTIVISTGAKQELLSQSISLLKLTKKLFPQSRIILSYHRGILPGKGTPPRKGISYSLIALYGRILGMEVRNVSGDLNKIAFYEDCDFHIGYRVHAHLDFLSRKKPSVLINEDGRGLGMVKTLNLPVFNYDDPHVLEKVEKQLLSYKKNSFSTFTDTFKLIHENFENMKEFLAYLKSLPSQNKK